MEKINVFFTGGTIGSLKSAQSIDVDVSTSYELIRLYHNSADKQMVQLDTVQPLNILSENLIPEDWASLISQLEQTDLSQYAGFIVTHGTDTLPFTAAALSFACRSITIPIVLIASNFPLDDPRGRGLQNFTYAVDFILDAQLPGVYVIFENNRGEAIVHLGTRLTQSDPFTDEYDSTFSIPFGMMRNKQFIPNADARNPVLSDIRSRQAAKISHAPLVFTHDLLYIKPHPGLNYQFYDFSSHKPQAVLHDLYHSGTACTRKALSFDASILNFIAYCHLSGVPVYIAPLKNISGDLYASAHQLLQAGAIPLVNISVESAMIKLMLAYGSLTDPQEINQFVQHTSLFFEIH